jgi:acylphosphatase
VTGGDTAAGGRIEAVVSGDVQGVGFRWFVVRVADRLGLTGWVANEADGSVRVVAEGRSDALDRLVELLREGPSGAVVEQVKDQRSAPKGEFGSFEIRARGHRGE